ncbi:N-formylglutamate deformylase [Roseiterribacter gracilis]|uniref:N-formylglutamate deformylase n=1 Tax=Roseiterribacter gracilis TaxID=2812848 RepID=A0A8S8X9E5_9PROT|nr:N-formylglutamate deformylase [Rhodospirillales bacterium TMPK1]
MNVVTVTERDAPLVISFPHVGTDIPSEIPVARILDDTDWDLPALYDFAAALNATTLVPRYSRLVVDLNRPPDDRPLYAGATTGLVPTECFDGRPLYTNKPHTSEIARRRDTYWRPYHDALRAQLDRLVALHGHVLLWDAHSIDNQIPRLFDGTLQDLSIGTFDGKSCSPQIRGAVAMAAVRHDEFSHIVDGRFKGGYITRHYGQPQNNVHAVQMELAKQTHLGDGTNWVDEKRAAKLRPVLREMIEAALAAL